MIEVKDLEKEFGVQCGACGEHIAENANKWPSEVKGSSICQTCWESECDDSWCQATNHGSFDTFD